MAYRVLLGGSWVVISGVISRVNILITQIRGLIIPLITTHEPPRRRDLSVVLYKESRFCEVWGFI